MQVEDQIEGVEQEDVLSEEQQVQQQPDATAAEPAEEMETVIEFEGSPAPVETAENQGIRQLREAFKREQQQRKEYERMLRERESSTSAAPVQSAMPRLEECGYDEDVFQQRMQQWVQAQHIQQAELIKRQQKEAAEQAEFQTHADRYLKDVADLAAKVPDYQDVESNVVSLLDEKQQKMIIRYADNAALVAYALGKNPQALADLQSTHDPVAFGKKLALLEKSASLKTRPKSKVQAETSIGSASGGGGINWAKRLQDASENPSQFRAVKKQAIAAGYDVSKFKL